MTKRPGAVSADTRQAIISSARDEFWEKGFTGTSLRQISRQVGVTTGAVYFFFDSKDQLFETVLSEAITPFWKFIRLHYAQERASLDPRTGTQQAADLEVAVVLIDSYFERRKTWDILIHNLNHPVVRSFLDEFIDESTDHYENLLNHMETRNPQVDRFTIHQFVHLQVDTMLNLISHDFGRQEMIGHAAMAVRMLKAAFGAMLVE